MKFTLSWLNNHLDTTAGVEEIAGRLTMLGLEVDGATDRARGMEDFVVAEVIEAKQHPDADKLQVCQVNTGTETLTVVCGAPNARAGMKGVFAATGCYIPGIDLKLKKAKIRGVVSNGMLLSEREMGLSDEHQGVIELPAAAAVGATAVEVMGLADPVIDIDITPNRGDCLGVRGVARDLAAAGLGTLKPLNAEPVPGAFESPIKVHLDFTSAAAGACPFFVGRYIRGVSNGESPGWLKDRLLAVGLRPISALVDITNLMTLDLCRPLHVFDADKIKGDLRVRLAKSGESMLALDGREYDLDAAMTVIADDDHAQALGGVIGGERSGCAAETVNVYVECAYFDPVRTAATGRKLNLTSDARFRFERGVDPAFLVPGMEVATRLILDLCGGEASEPVIAGKEPEGKRDIGFRRGRIQALGGVEVPAEEVKRIFGALGFMVAETGAQWRVSVPSWRGDIIGEACLVEEIVRVFGYDNIPTVAMERPSALPPPALDASQRRRAAARRVLAGRGLVEAVTLSFMPSEQAEPFGGAPDSIRLLNPISSDLDAMRPSILPNLISAVGRNADRGTPDACLFEIGPRFAGDRPEDQSMVAAGVRAGRSGLRNWAEPSRPVDVFDAKADALAVFGELALPVDKLRVGNDAPPWYHPGRSGLFRLGPKTVLASFGEIHPRALRKMDVKGPIIGFEIFLDNFPKPKTRKTAAKPHLELPSFQPVERDFAFVVDKDIAAEALMRAAKGADAALIAEVRVFDLFAGGNLGEAKKSLAINVVLQPTEKTLTEAEIDAVAEKVIASVEAATGGVLRK